MIILAILTASLIHFSLKDWENVFFELGSERFNLKRGLQAVSVEMEERKTQLQSVTERAGTLRKSLNASDSDRINKQVQSMSSQWENLGRHLSHVIRSTPDVLEAFCRFNQIHDSLCDWLAGIEASVLQELEESFLSSTDDQGDTVFQVWVTSAFGFSRCTHLSLSYTMKLFFVKLQRDTGFA